MTLLLAKRRLRSLVQHQRRRKYLHVSQEIRTGGSTGIARNQRKQEDKEEVAPEVGAPVP